MANKRIHDLDDTATTLDSGAYFAVDSDSYTAAKKFAADSLPDPTGATDGYVWTADGANGAAWEAVSGGASDVTDLTTTTGSSTNMVRVAAAGGLEYRTVAQVLSDIGAAAASHTHGAGDIASGTLVHERGGLEADVSAYAGLVKISGGSTSAVTVTAFGESLIDDSDASTARTTLGLGTMATEATGSYLAATGVTTGAASQAQTFTLGVVTGANGLDVNPGSDIDADLITVGVTGAPTVSWDESEDAFAFTHGVTVAGNSTIEATTQENIHALIVQNNNAMANSVTYAQMVVSNQYNAASGHATIVLDKAATSAVNSFAFTLAGASKFEVGTYNGNFFIRDTASSGLPFKFVIEPSTHADILRLDNNGRVGIRQTEPTAQLHVDQSSATAAVPVLLLDQADDSEQMIEFTGTVGTGNAIEAVGAKTLTTTHFIKCTITGVGNVYIPVGTIA